MTLQIGVHPNNLHLLLAQYWPGAFPDLDVAFVPYAEGRDTGSPGYLRAAEYVDEPLVHGLVGDVRVTPHIDDIEALNIRAATDDAEVTKVSIAAYG